jgi:hypothetical protein
VRNTPEPVPATTTQEPPKPSTAKLTRPLKKVSAKTTPPLPSAPAANCSPNYYIDAQGDKRFKPECFLQKKITP